MSYYYSKDLFHFFLLIIQILFFISSLVTCWVSIWLTKSIFHERSYNENYTPSRPLWEVKSHLAWSVVRWVTTCEARVLFVLLNITFVLFTPTHTSTHLFILITLPTILIYNTHSITRYCLSNRLIFKGIDLCPLFSPRTTLLSITECQNLLVKDWKLFPGDAVWVMAQYDHSEGFRFRLRGEMKSIKISAMKSNPRALIGSMKDQTWLPVGPKKWFSVLPLSLSQDHFSLSFPIEPQELYTQVSDLRISRKARSAYIRGRLWSNGFLGGSHGFNLTAHQVFSLWFWWIPWRERRRKVNRTIIICYSM